MKDRELATEALRLSFGWLAVGNAVGLLMAALLLFPGLGAALGPLTYGRWAAVHVDLQMYGWCSLPLLALLFHLYLPRGGSPRLAVWALRSWSAALAFLAVSLLTGHSSGKVFVDWSGAARWVFAAALAFTSLAVIAAYVQRLHARRRGELAEGRLGLALKGLGLLALVPAPVAMVVAAAPGLYPPINPQSGGATSGNTLASVLGVGAVLVLSPFLAGLKPRDGGRFSAVVGAALFLHFGFLALLGPGDHRNDEPLQLAALISALIWLPLVAEHWRRFAWPAGSRPWLGAMAGWGLVLTLSGLLAGLPGTADRIKYTNVLVGHVHAAAAGVVTAWLFVVLATVAEQRGLRRRRRRALFADGPAFWSWQVGCVLQVGALFLVGWAEGANPQILWSGAPLVSAGYAVRLLGGLLMAAAAWRWLAALGGRVAAAEAPSPKEERSAIVAGDLLPSGRRL